MPTFVIPSAEFVLSAPDVAHAPKRSLPEIAFAGRSNVGKSSLINSLLNRKQLALTSRTPGKTQLLNYFLIGNGLCYFVDLPGYGYARASGHTIREWGRFIEEYLQRSSRLALVVLILDIRRGLTPLDKQMVDALSIFRRPWLALLTKADKLTTQARNESLNSLAGLLVSQGARAVLPYSAQDHFGREAVWERLLETLRPSR